MQLDSVDFLDVTFDYIIIYSSYIENLIINRFIFNKQSNHPPNVLKQLPKSIAKRISYASSSK